MTIYFGLELDQLVYPEHENGGYWYCGAKRILTFLETHLGLGGYPTNNEFLRIEQFRQAIQKHQSFDEKAFYLASFEADPLATATALLDRRDELVLGNWNFIPTPKTPVRLRTLAEIENIAQTGENGLGLSMGFSDRWLAVEKTLPTRTIPLEKVWINEPFDLLPDYIKRLISILKKKNIAVESVHHDVKTEATDLGFFKNSITQKAQNGKAKGDGSLVILKSKRGHALATFLAKLFQKNRKYQPLCLIPEKNRALDNALIQEGLPSLGILSESLARPSLQILKLAPAFLWKPIDPYKVMEFVSLTVKPLRDDLANIIANEIARTPGIRGDRWRFMIKNYFDELKVRALSDEEKNIDVLEVQNQYSFWFGRDRYEVTETVPKDIAAEIFDYVGKWAKKVYENDKSNPASMLVLSEQAYRIVELIETLPIQEEALSYLQLERIVRTIYEPSPVSFKEREVGDLNYIHHNSAIIEPVDQLLWWNFLDNEPPYFFSKWYLQEYNYLETLQVYLDRPKMQNDRLLWQRIRPVTYTNKQIVFCLPAMVDGSTVHPHPLMGNLAACFENLDDLIIDVDDSNNFELLEKLGLALPKKEALSNKTFNEPKPFLRISQTEMLESRESESYTSLDALMYYPYKWVFQYKLKLRKSSILSIVKDYTLMGNLAHKVFENMFRKEDVLDWDTPKIMNWIGAEANYVMEREGAVLLMYGREPERASFVNKLKFAASTLIKMIKNNGWKIQATEKKLEDTFMEIEIKGVADLVLENEKGELAIIDLKWSGAAKRFQLIRNQEDLQLVMYSKLLTKNDDWAHTAFFIMEQGKMISRNNLAFKEAMAVDPNADHEAINLSIWEKIKATYQWRMKQLEAGSIEIRTEQTLLDIEEQMTAEELMALLEMKSKNARYDDFKALIGVLE